MKKISRVSFIVTTVLCLFCLYHLGFYESIHTSVENISAERDFRIIAVDAGHGGYDPGKVSGDLEEKDINLQVALELKKELTKAGFLVVMTREEDTALFHEEQDDTYYSRKHSDLRQRLHIAESAKADLFLSIHCNSYPGKSQGAQTFYGKGKADSEELALSIQKELVSYVDPANHRTALTGDYYILTNEVCPTTIVEVGFLSSAEEKEKLQTKEYQKKLADGIVRGVFDYFSKAEEKENIQS